MSHKKWNREQKAKDDEKQAILAPETQTGVQLRQHPTTEFTAAHTGIYMCPFCLHQDKIEKYLISTSKGYHHGLAKCPECGNQMRFSSLTADWTPEQYAEFVYPYSVDGFWQKCPFEKWKDRLYKIGWAHRFWKRYKELKGEEGEETETIQTRQEKMRGECQHCGEKNPPDTVMCKYCGHRLIEAYG